MKKEKIKQVFAWYDLLILAGMLAVGVALVLFSQELALLGGLVIVCVFVLAPLVRHGYKLPGRPGTYRLEAIPVSRASRQAVQDYLAGECEDLDAAFFKQRGALVMVYYQKHTNETLAQFYEYDLALSGALSPVVPISPQQLETLKKMAASVL